MGVISSNNEWEYRDKEGNILLEFIKIIFRANSGVSECFTANVAI